MPSIKLPNRRLKTNELTIFSQILPVASDSRPHDSGFKRLIPTLLRGPEWELAGEFANDLRSLRINFPYSITLMCMTTLLSRRGLYAGRGPGLPRYTITVPAPWLLVNAAVKLG